MTTAPRHIGIVGSRPPKEPALDWQREHFADLLRRVTTIIESLPASAVIISGGADGVDTHAAEVARRRGMQVVEHLPGHEPSPERYYLRNQRIVDDASELICGATQWARGSWDSVRRAKKRGIPVSIVRSPL